ncbi:hypothetical protein AMJ39_05680 [candidate division TA06 bacterium DG_24]|uniref:Uncharacterized protein n=2 Tax=Bacteria division TA06 TaxID=1156500 RepID=A0A0S8G893_UNCT6|nr:MAG: hypothetical protein AMJ39_05680 [candidate division TA06 bacterium DG_24]KPK69272.1 MAG: hypothetical protein AMJ82_06040 [candidate division TA06 bacterium SM23_40]
MVHNVRLAFLEGMGADPWSSDVAWNRLQREFHNSTQQISDSPQRQQLLGVRNTGMQRDLLRWWLPFYGEDSAVEDYLPARGRCPKAKRQ